MKRIVLASASPRRQMLLNNAGLIFDTAPADVDETVFGNESGQEAAERLAVKKACHVAGVLSPGTVVIAADTVVIVDNESGHGEEVLGKPSDAADAARMLKLISARKHRVVTGFALLESGRADSLITGSETTYVQFRAMSDDEIDWYIKTGEPADKAGAYAVQGKGALFIERLEGCYFNVVGLPLQRIMRELSAFGIGLGDLKG